MRLMEIRKILKHKSSKKNKESTLKFASTVKIFLIGWFAIP